MKLHKKGAEGIKQMNLGTSYLVAPLYTQRKEFKDKLGWARNEMQQQNEDYLRAQTHKDGHDEQEDGQEEAGNPGKKND